MAQCNQLEEGRARCEESLVHMREMGDQWGLSLTLQNCGTVALWQGHADKAEELAQESLQVAETLSNEPLMLAANHLLAQVALYRGNDLIASRYLSTCSENLQNIANQNQVEALLESYITLFSNMRQPLIALQLAGMIAKQRNRNGFVLPPFRKIQFEDAVAAARQQIRDEVSDRAWSMGQSMTVKEAIELVQSHQPEIAVHVI